ncbi:N-chimaerin-like isoform X1 [Argiope bruennichi]|uniref:Beta-chimaerin n=1 Tax=Argiope bruennichi TaxID=94029 RepID=A0A8T0FHX6_ARGBR|nr:N-chimaerin-like isoform X1 [Argiope bruennichi]KAF8790576.1 N-chimaerin like protein [Argiope bruennichi]
MAEVTHSVVFSSDGQWRNRPPSKIPSLWKSYLYQLQQEAPIPKRILCNREIPGRPAHYGREFHGKISREEAERLLVEDGCYLVRESQRAVGQYTLSMKFAGVTKNFKLYYDKKHYVGEKRFDTIQDLVADGLISMYLEAHAGDYIATMCMESKYEDSPYMTLNSYKRKITRNRSRSSIKHAKDEVALKKDISKCDTFHEYDRPPIETSTNDVFVPEDGDDIDVLQFEKPHVFKTNNFIGLPWCDFCGNFMWGLIAQGVKCEDCGFNAHKKCSEKVPNDCMPDLKYVKRVFGVDLITLVKAHNTLRPFVVDLCIKETEKRGLDVEGLYRVSGFSDEIEMCRMVFERDCECADISRNAFEDINVITGVLKLFFRLLPIPLITFEAYSSFIAAAKKPALGERLEALKEALKSLPPAHYQTLKFLMAHLYRVAERQKYNLMTPQNLSTVFCPTLMRCPEIGGVPDQLTAWHAESTVIEMLITHHRQLFDH